MTSDKQMPDEIWAYKQSSGLRLWSKRPAHHLANCSSRRISYTRTAALREKVEGLRKHAPQGEAIVEYRGSDTEIADHGFNAAIAQVFELIGENK